MSTGKSILPIMTCSHTFEANKEPFHKRLAEVLPKALDQMGWSDNELILYHGCSTGSTCLDFLAPRAAATNSTVYGLNICGEMIEYAKSHNHHPNIKYVHGSLTSKDSPVKDLKFNKIISVYTMLFIEDHKKELEILYHHLAPGGYIYFIFKLETHQFDLVKAVLEDEKWNQHAKVSGHLVVPSWIDNGAAPEDILRQDFTDAGFEVKKLSREEETVVFKNPHEFADLMFSLNSFVNNLDKNDHQELKDTYRKYFVEAETKTHVPNPNSASEWYTWDYQSLKTLLRKPEDSLE